MHYHVVFPRTRSFGSLAGFLAGVRQLAARSDDKYYANFFLFGEDILGLIDQGRIIDSFRQGTIGKPVGSPLVSHEQVLAFIQKLQNVLGPKDFVVFSLYCTFSDFVVNAAYFVGNKQWFFDLKRYLAKGDQLVLAPESQEFHRVQAKLNAKLSRCAKAGPKCLKNVYFFVCADILLLGKARLAENSLVFIPACGLPEARIRSGFNGISGSGRAFVNDPGSGLVWDIPFGKNAAKPGLLKFGGHHQLFLDFELN